MSWLRGQPALHTRAKQVDVALQWLKDMGAQLGANMVKRPKRKEPEDLKEEGKWLDAPELMARVEEVR